MNYIHIIAASVPERAEGKLYRHMGTESGVEKVEVWADSNQTAVMNPLHVKEVF